MPYKKYEVGEEGRAARLVLQYEESDAMDKGLQQKIRLLANHLLLAKDLEAKISCGETMTIEADWKLGDYFFMIKGRDGSVGNISCRLLPEGFALAIGEEKYILKRK